MLDTELLSNLQSSFSGVDILQLLSSRGDSHLKRIALW